MPYRKDKFELIENIADLVSMDDQDEKAVEFDNVMYVL